jgi:hypothetical protein
MTASVKKRKHTLSNDSKKSQIPTTKPGTTSQPKNESEKSKESSRGYRYWLRQRARMMKYRQETWEGASAPTITLLSRLGFKSMNDVRIAYKDNPRIILKVYQNDSITSVRFEEFIRKVILNERGI